MRKIKNIFLILSIMIASSCGDLYTKRLLKTYKQVAKTGVVGFMYKFEDKGDRQLEINFVDKSTVEVRNRTSIGHHFSLVAFTSQYSYKFVDFSTLHIMKKLSSNKELTKNKYLKPYDFRQNTLDSTIIQYIFPDIEGDTIRFSNDFKKLQIREFNFEKI